jgi:hypothetical protein
MPNQPAETDSWNFALRVHLPVQMINGRNDFIFPADTNQKPLFEALGTRATDKKHILYEGGHSNLVTRPDLIGRGLGLVRPVSGSCPYRELNPFWGPADPR